MRTLSIRTLCGAVLISVVLAGCGGGGAASPSASLAASKSIATPPPSSPAASSTTSTTTVSTAPAVSSPAPAPTAPATSTTATKSTSSSWQQGWGPPFSLSGTPLATVTAGQAYHFTPSVGNASGTVTFHVQNAPRWASFNASTGTLSGTPAAANAATYGNIVISASTAAQGTVSLAAFSITVLEANSGTGSADVSWTPPTTNTDGSTLTNLAGYTIYYGTSPGSLTQKVQITNIGVTDYLISGLSSGTWYFAVTAYTSSGTQSTLSNVASKTI